VKQPFAIPFIFLLSVLCTLAVFSALDLFTVWGQAGAGGGITAGLVLQRLPRSLFLSIIPSVVVSLVITGFRIARKPGSRFLALILCLATSYIVLVNGMILLDRLVKTVRPAAAATPQYFQPQAFQRVGDDIVGAQSVAADSLKGVLLYSSAGSRQTAPRLFVYPSGRLSRTADSLSLDLIGNPPARLTQKVSPEFSSIFVPDPLTGLFLRDINVLTSDFEQILSRSMVEFFVACFALLFLCTASMAILRFTRWPLINVLLYIVAVRLYFLLYHFLSVGLAPEAAKVITDPLVAKLFPSVVFAVLGVVFLLVDVLFVPDRGLKGEAP
jgi:hypothetical protein